MEEGELCCRSLPFLPSPLSAHRTYTKNVCTGKKLPDFIIDFPLNSFHSAFLYSRPFSLPCSDLFSSPNNRKFDDFHFAFPGKENFCSMRRENSILRLLLHPESTIFNSRLLVQRFMRQQMRFSTRNKFELNFSGNGPDVCGSRQIKFPWRTRRREVQSKVRRRRWRSTASFRWIACFCLPSNPSNTSSGFCFHLHLRQAESTRAFMIWFLNISRLAFDGSSTHALRHLSMNDFHISLLSGIKGAPLIQLQSLSVIKTIATLCRRTFHYSSSGGLHTWERRKKRSVFLYNFISIHRPSHVSATCDSLCYSLIATYSSIHVKGTEKFEGHARKSAK